MKKGIVVLFILLILPLYIDAACNNDMHEKLKNDAKNITQEIKYYPSSGNFSVIYYNVSEGIYANYNNKKYAQKDNVIEIGNLSEGTSLTILFYTNSGCSNEIDIRRVSIPYKNNYYKSALCDGYENILRVCNSEFLHEKTTKESIMSAIENYENTIPPYVPPKEEVIVEPTFFEKTVDFAKTWGIKIGLSVASSIITILIGSILYRKELHGV